MNKKKLSGYWIFHFLSNCRMADGETSPVRGRKLTAGPGGYEEEIQRLHQPLSTGSKYTQGRGTDFIINPY